MKDILLRRTYCDILNGYSLDVESRLFVKHLTNIDQADFDYVYYEYYQKLKLDGVPTNEEMTELLESIGEWTKKDNNEIERQEDYLKRLELSKSKLLRKSDKQEIQKEIDEVAAAINAHKKRKESLFSQTCESYASARQFNAYIIGSIYSDPKLEKRVISNEMFDEMTDAEFEKYISIYYKAIESVTEKKIKQLACSPMFQQPFRLVESFYDFFGKPMSHLTFYQIILGAYGKNFKTIFENHEIPEKIIDDPDEILEFVNASQEVKNKIANKPRNTNLVGLTSEDYEKLGVDRPQNIADIMGEGTEMISKDKIIELKSKNLI